MLYIKNNIIIYLQIQYNKNVIMQYNTIKNNNNNNNLKITLYKLLMESMLYKLLIEFMKTL